MKKQINSQKQHNDSLIFVGTFSIRIPNPATGGYFHMGDSMIFLSVLILGKRDGAFAGALGGALADLLCSAAIWIGPTLIIKFIMAWIMGIIWEQYPSKIISAIGGGVFQIIAYTAAETFYLLGPLRGAFTWSNYADCWWHYYFMLS